ncbi:hypothetical protein KCU65_g4319, partial [Aureobasidium melanogenum]
MARTISPNRAARRAFERAHLKAERKREREFGRLVAAMKRRKHILALKIVQKIERKQPLSEIEWAYMERGPRMQHKPYNPSKTGHGFLTPDQISELEKLSENVPPILFRAFTTTGTGHTQGFATPTLYAPSGNFMSDLQGRLGERHPTWIYDSINDIPLQDLRVMVGAHLLWRDRIPDELLSWSMSYLFATVHLYRRHLDGQEIGYIAMINRTRAVRPQNWYLERLKPQQSTPARFNFANDHCEYTGVYDHEWPCSKDLPGLHPRKINHEVLTHGAVAYPEDDPLMQTSWKDLVAAGIFELVPELKIYFDCMVAGLYTVLRYIRTTNYNKVRRTTEHELAIALGIAWLYTRLPPGETREGNRPNLWALLHLLSFHKRESGDDLFKDLIRRLGYTRKFFRPLSVLKNVICSYRNAQYFPGRSQFTKTNFQCFLGADLDENLYAAFGEFPANLPELHSLYHLAVDVQAVVNGPPLPALVLTHIYSRVPLPNDMELRDDAEYDKTCKPSLIDLITKGYEIKRRCGLSCDCAIWGPISKPREKRVVGPGQSGDEVEHNEDQTQTSDQTEHSSPGESTLLVEQEAEHQTHHLDEHQSQHVNGYLQDLFDTEPAESLGKSTPSLPSRKDHEMNQTSDSQSQRHSMHEELNTMLLTYKYVSKTNY